MRKRRHPASWKIMQRWSSVLTLLCGPASSFQDLRNADNCSNCWDQVHMESIRLVFNNNWASHELSLQHKMLATHSLLLKQIQPEKQTIAPLISLFTVRIQPKWKLNLPSSIMLASTRIPGKAKRTKNISDLDTKQKRNLRERCDMPGYQDSLRSCRNTINGNCKDGMEMRVHSYPSPKRRARPRCVDAWSSIK